MITFEEAYGIMMDTARFLGPEEIDLDHALGRVLVQDVVSDIDVPPFNKSAMDGYACRRADLGNGLKVIENIPAGCSPRKRIGENECAKIMTGAVVPEGADVVIMVEHTEEAGGDVIRFTREDTESNICYKGEDIKAGDRVLSSGTLIRPEHIAVMASVGCVVFMVSQRARVGIIVTGSELVDAREKAEGAKIRDSNGRQLAAQVERMGVMSTSYGITADAEDVLDAAVRRAVAENDVVIVSGGVSVGDFDLVPEVFRKNGVDILFDRVAIKPGKPSTFGTVGDVRCFGLPGNPVSVFMQFELFIKPYIYKMMCHDYIPRVVAAELDGEVRRGKAARAEVIPVKFISPGKVGIIDYHGSAHIGAICNADGVIVIPVGETLTAKGTVVDVRLF